MSYHLQHVPCVPFIVCQSKFRLKPDAAALCSYVCRTINRLLFAIRSRTSVENCDGMEEEKIDKSFFFVFWERSERRRNGNLFMPE